MCGNRCVLFNNKTKEKKKKSEQLKTLFSLVNTVVYNNGGKPYTDDIFVELMVSEADQHFVAIFQKCLS